MPAKPATSRDINFDALSQKFTRSIYDTPKGQIRLEVLMHQLTRDIPELTTQSWSVLDAGGGQGQLSLKLAQLGHRVTLCDISSEMLEQAQANYHAAQQAEALSVHLCAIQDLPAHNLPQYPLVMCHAVLEWLADPKQAVRILANQVKPGGYLSLMFWNYDAVVFNNVIRGNLHWALTDQVSGHGKTLSPTNPQKPAKVQQWLEDLGMELVSHGGIRVFHDYVKQPLKQQGQQGDLLALEKRYFDQSPYRDLGRYTHFIYRKPG